MVALVETYECRVVADEEDGPAAAECLRFPLPLLGEVPGPGL